MQLLLKFRCAFYLVFMNIIVRIEEIDKCQIGSVFLAVVTCSLMTCSLMIALRQVFVKIIWGQFT